MQFPEAAAAVTSRQSRAGRRPSRALAQANDMLTAFQQGNYSRRCGADVEPAREFRTCSPRHSRSFRPPQQRCSEMGAADNLPAAEAGAGAGAVDVLAAFQQGDAHA